MVHVIFFGDNIDVDPRLVFFRELVILNKCEGSQSCLKERYFALLSMTNNIWVNSYIIAFFVKTPSVVLTPITFFNLLLCVIIINLYICEQMSVFWTM